MAKSNKASGGNEATDTKKRVYWNTPEGLEHGFVRGQKGKDYQVYSYATGMIVLVKNKDVEKVITEVLS